MMTVDGNEAAASVAYRLCDVTSIYPITPSSPMGEWADQWASEGATNIWGAVPTVTQMQSEGGVAGAIHGVLQCGGLATTFTASQGLLLMLPNMYKIAGELLPTVIHVAARTVATHALSIFGDHSDVMAARQTGFAMLAANTVQEAHDLACISHAATFETRLPFLHFFDGFRTSHEVAKIERLDDAILHGMLDHEAIAAFRRRALSPNHPCIRGTAQNPDTFFQQREASNGFYDACPAIVQRVMDRFASLAGRAYRLFDYEGAADADRVIVAMGSGAETAAVAAAALNAGGERVGVLKVRLYRPFSIEHFVAALPATIRAIAVLDRTKEPGAVGEPLYQDVVAALREHIDAGRNHVTGSPTVIGGRFGLSSKEFTPAMAKAVFDELKESRPRKHFTVGILDDVTHLSLPWDDGFDPTPTGEVRAQFFGLGADGTVGANKNSIKIIGEETDLYAQGYFVYDSKKSGAMTISHLRFGPQPIRSPYLIRKASFIACHQFQFLDRMDVLESLDDAGIVLLNAPYPADRVWDELPRDAQEKLIDRRARLYTIDALTVARDADMGGRINTIMQTCFFAISGVLPREEAIAQIKKAIEKTYGRKGAEVVRRNFEAVDATLAHLHEVTIPASPTQHRMKPPAVSASAPDLVQRVTAIMIAGQGDRLPVSALPVDGTWPTGTTRWEKRRIAAEIPIWDPAVCVQCNKCAFVCPHAAIRATVVESTELAEAPASFQSCAYKAPDLRGLEYIIQVAPEDCTGCTLCVMVCPAKNKAEPRLKAINMQPMLDHVEAEKANYDFFLGLPDLDRQRITRLDVKGSQFLLPLFEYSGACSGCGETPYIKLLTQLFGDRLLIANATGCSSIYGGNLPTTPYTTNRLGRGPAWANSLFEDNAEFGLGMRVASDALRDEARRLLGTLDGAVDPRLAAAILEADESTDAAVDAQRERVALLMDQLRSLDTREASRLRELHEHLVRQSVWILGGDGWAYDIGFGGLDHVIAQQRNVNILVLDTEVYSNTGGQQSKATPLGAAAKFAANGKAVHKKDLGLIAMSYGHVYVANVAFGANDNQTVKAFLEAESFDGPSIIIAYSHCIAHGYDLKHGLTQQQLAVESGIWPLYRYDPRRGAVGEPPLQLDSKPPKVKVRDYMRNEARFRMVEKIDPQRFARLAKQAETEAAARVELYRQLAQIKTSPIVTPKAEPVSV
jgi:pyruvate-ferredoxin/flavodoxin oxidoreductase